MTGMCATISERATERRTERRYYLQLRLRWALRRGSDVLARGSGSTIDLSANGILFDSGKPLPAGLTVELKIAWPVLGAHREALEFSALGVIVRSDGCRIALRTVRRMLAPILGNGRQHWPLSSDRGNSAEAESLETMDAPWLRQ